MRHLAREGVRVVAVSTVLGALVDAEGLDVPALDAAAAREGDAFVLRGGRSEPAEILDATCDVLVPCAGSRTIDVAAARRTRAAIVVGGANDPFDEGAEAALLGRGAVVVPDFVANGGGVLGSTLACSGGAGPAEVEALIRRCFGRRLERTIELAVGSERPVAEVAERSALRFLERCDRLYGQSQAPSLLPEALAPQPALPLRAMLRLERRTRGSRKLARLGRWLRPMASRRLADILSEV
jgi:glutamate dehydrogenase/leucine dehydrogenase